MSDSNSSNSESNLHQLTTQLTFQSNKIIIINDTIIDAGFIIKNNQIAVENESVITNTTFNTIESNAVPK